MRQGGSRGCDFARHVFKAFFGSPAPRGRIFFFLMGKLVKALAVFPEPAKFKEEKGWGIESPSPIRHLVVLPGQWNIVE